jgi:hypothetical protein
MADPSRLRALFLAAGFVCGAVASIGSAAPIASPDPPAPVVLNRQPGWRGDQVLVFEALNRAEHMINLVVEFRGRGRKVDVRVGIFPGWPARIAIPIDVASGKTLFLDRTPGRFKAIVQGANLAFDQIDSIRLAAAPGAERDVEIRDARLADAMPAEYGFPAKPLIDGLHQWRARDWPGKAKTLDEVREALRAELKGPEPAYPDGWSAYGGWKGKTFEAAGFFRARHDGARWWLVDPDGCAFWSAGVDCIRTRSEANVAGIEAVFDPPLPARDAAPHLWSDRGPSRLFDGLGHNLERALGPTWREDWLALTRRRLIASRFNTIGNWSDADLQRRARVPYVFTMRDYPRTQRMLFRDFPDVYAEEYEARCREFARPLEAIRDDRCVIGYFMTNEPQWAFVSQFDLGRQLLRSDEPSATRDAFIAFLKDRHGDVGRLNAAWKTSFASFDDLRRRHDPDAFPGCREDTQAFTRRAVERFVAFPAKACRAADPNHLNLGLRWAWIHSDYQLAGGEHLDAFSINSYQPKPNPETIARIVEKTGKPVLVGEFHIGSLDRGLPSGGILNTRTMAESVKAYRYYIENAAAIPGLVGAHYFQWNDQHVMGRFDGENMQIGLHDITGRAYPEWVETCRAVHPALYEIAAGKRKPFDEKPKTVREGTLCW